MDGRMDGRKFIFLSSSQDKHQYTFKCSLVAWLIQHWNPGRGLFQSFMKVANAWVSRVWTDGGAQCRGQPSDAARTGLGEHSKRRSCYNPVIPVTVSKQLGESPAV